MALPLVTSDTLSVKVLRSYGNCKKTLVAAQEVKGRIVSRNVGGKKKSVSTLRAEEVPINMVSLPLVAKY